MRNPIFSQPLSPDQRRMLRDIVEIGVSMKKELFDELIESAREGGAILRGERAPSRFFRFDGPDIRGLRERHGLTQSRFAASGKLPRKRMTA